MKKYEILQIIREKKHRTFIFSPFFLHFTNRFSIFAANFIELT